MSWVVKGPVCEMRVPTAGGSLTGDLAIVSTSTVDADVDGVQTWRMYGDFEKLLSPIASAVGYYAAASVQQPGRRVCGGEREGAVGPFDYVAYLDTPASTAMSSSTRPFALETHLVTGEVPLRSTCVPTRRAFEGWKVQYIDNHANFDAATGIGTGSFSGATGEVVLTAPHVVKAPSARGWFMILNRLRTFNLRPVVGPDGEIGPLPGVEPGPFISIDYSPKVWEDPPISVVGGLWFDAITKRHGFAGGGGAPLPQPAAEYRPPQGKHESKQRAREEGSFPPPTVMPAGAVAQTEAGFAVTDPTGNLGDIVAYYCDDPSFTGNTLVGPILLLDSLAALPEAGFRVWAGVAGGAFVQDDSGNWALYLYFAAEFPAEPYLAVEADGFATAYESYVDGRLARWTDAMFQRTEIDAQFAGKAHRMLSEAGGIGAKRIAWGDLLLAVLTHQEGTPESDWTAADAVPGDLLGLTWTWVAENPIGSATRSVTGFRRKFTWEQVQRTTDPAPLVDESGAQLSLFFAALPNPGPGYATVDGRNGHGIWRAAAIPSGERLWYCREGHPGPRHTEFGVDFVVGRVDASHDSADLVARGVSKEELKADGKDIATVWPDLAAWGITDAPAFADPDPFLRSDGWCGIFTQGASFGTESGGEPIEPVLAWIEGDTGDLSRSWMDAWS